MFKLKDGLILVVYAPYLLLRGERVYQVALVALGFLLPFALLGGLFLLADLLTIVNETAHPEAVVLESLESA